MQTIPKQNSPNNDIFCFSSPLQLSTAKLSSAQEEKSANFFEIITKQKRRGVSLKRIVVSKLGVIIKNLSEWSIKNFYMKYVMVVYKEYFICNIQQMLYEKVSIYWILTISSYIADNNSFIVLPTTWF